VGDVTCVWFAVWFAVNMPSPELSFTPANGWSVTLLLAVALDLGARGWQR